ncbi:MAG: T9SS type B sorting domain-containing protein, partial [Flavobacteriaceae bacterium]
AEFTNITPGTHYLAIASVESGCVVTYEFEITNFEALELELTQQRFNVITASGIGGDGEYRYEAEGANPINDNEFYINETGTYTVTVTDGNGCTATEEIFMEFIDVEIPNFFTPDGDGFNDTWKPKNLDAYPNAFITIYDRYGREVYQISADSTPWDGSYSEVDLPSGDYWYIMKLNGENDKREFVGHFNLSRNQQ